MTDLARHFAAHGDLAHLALFLWASSASAIAVWALKEVARCSERFEDFVTAIARVNAALAASSVIQSKPPVTSKQGASQ